VSDAGDPVRLSQSPNEGDATLARLFRAGERDLPNAKELDSLAARLAPAVGSPPEAPRRPPFAKLGALGLGAAAVAALVAGYFAMRSPAPDRAPNPSVPTAPSAPSAPPPSANAAPSVPAVEPPAAAEQPRASAKPVPSALKSARERVPDEAKLLEQARRALSTNPSQALAITRRHQALYPNGALAQEREVIAIEALRRLGKSGQASERADSFEQKYPDSAHRRTVEKGLAK
jgi:hypothetical protein